jgi:hypothetical protein
MRSVQIFVSAVSGEFGTCRNELNQALTPPNVAVRIQEDFMATRGETLDKLDDHLKDCDAVIHLVGDVAGAIAQDRAEARAAPSPSEHKSLGYRLALASSIACIKAACSHFTALHPFFSNASGSHSGGLSPL